MALTEEKACPRAPDTLWGLPLTTSTGRPSPAGWNPTLEDRALTPALLLPTQITTMVASLADLRAAILASASTSHRRTTCIRTTLGSPRAPVVTVVVVAVVGVQAARRRDTTSCRSSVVARAHAEEDRLELREGLRPCDLCHRALGGAVAAGLGANPSTCTSWGLSGILCSRVRRVPVAAVVTAVAAVPVVAEEREILGWKRFQGC